MVVHVYNIKVIQEHNLFINTDTAMLLQEFQTNLFAPVRVSTSHKVSGNRQKTCKCLTLCTNG